MNIFTEFQVKERIALRLLEAEQHRSLAPIRARDAHRRRVVLRRLFGWITRLMTGRNHTRLASATNPLQGPKWFSWNANRR
jgi:hypothetical protein